MKYIGKPKFFLEHDSLSIPSFVEDEDYNIDEATVRAFAKEWALYNEFSDEDLEQIGAEYFDIINLDDFGDDAEALDIGCGSGRWSIYVAPFFKKIEALDPNVSIVHAASINKKYRNIRFTHASVSAIPFPDNSFDLVFSLGVLHHVPNTNEAIAKAIQKVKPGGSLLLYLYYALDNRGWGYKQLFKGVNLIRLFISRMPAFIKEWSCDLIALLIYLPLSYISLGLQLTRLRPLILLGLKMPLAYYAGKSFTIMRNDALDRFGTPLEKRFTKHEIYSTLCEYGMTEIIFSENAPFWHVRAKKPTANNR